MKNYELEDIVIEGRTGTWYEIDRRFIKNELYVLFESEQYGDETACVLCKIPPLQFLSVTSKGRIKIPERYEVYETYDDIETALDEAGIEDDSMPYEELQEIKEQLGIQLNLLDEFSRKFKK